MSKSFLKSSGIFTAMTFISRIFGLIRDQIIAIFFGANALTDAFFVAFKIPNFLEDSLEKAPSHKLLFHYLQRQKHLKNQMKLI